MKLRSKTKPPFTSKPKKLINFIEKHKSSGAAGGIYYDSALEKFGVNPWKRTARDDGGVRTPN